jgi:uncharacterized protein with FMN-binding domain
MKKILVSLFLVAAFAGYLLFYRRSPEVIINTPEPTVSTTATNTPTPTATVPSTATPTATPKPSTGQYRNGTYTGSVADAFYGNVQVKATITGGKLTDVTFLQYPSDREHSLELSNYAMPILTSEAIQAQSANVDAVSGATQTSEAFKQSLAAALALAH